MTMSGSLCSPRKLSPRNPGSPTAQLTGSAQNAEPDYGIAAAQAAGITMYFTGTRHFFH